MWSTSAYFKELTIVLKFYFSKILTCFAGLFIPQKKQ